MANGIKAEHVFYVVIGLFVGVGGHAFMLFKRALWDYISMNKKRSFYHKQHGGFFHVTENVVLDLLQYHKKWVAFIYKYIPMTWWQHGSMITSVSCSKNCWHGFPLNWVPDIYGPQRMNPDDLWFFFFFLLKFSFNLTNISTSTSLAKHFVHTFMVPSGWRMNHNVIGDPLISPWVWHFWLWVKYLNKSSNFAHTYSCPWINSNNF